MKIPTARFFLKDPKAKKDTLIYLAYRIPHETKRVVFSTKEYCNPKFWDTKMRRVKNTVLFGNCRAVNKQLNILAETAEGIFMEHDGNISSDDFKHEMEYRTGRTRKKKNRAFNTFIEYIALQIELERNSPNIKESSAVRRGNALKHLREYSQANGLELYFEDINMDFKRDFENYLYSPPLEHSTNNVYKTFSIIRSYMEQSYLNGLHTNTIHLDKRFKIKKAKSQKKVRLTPEEEQALINHDFSYSEHLDKVRDMLVAACYSGLRISDWSKIRKENIISYNDRFFLNISTKKTNTEVNIPIMQPLLDLLYKYDYNLPIMTDQPFNRSIKKVAEIVFPHATFIQVYSAGGIERSKRVPKYKYISSHTGRKTLASNRYLEGWSLRKIKNILGHSNEKQTEEYMDITDWELSKRDTEMIGWAEAAKTSRRWGN